MGEEIRADENSRVEPSIEKDDSLVSGVGTEEGVSSN
jgi:hypothetical protein